jgi:hypothetical protein
MPNRPGMAPTMKHFDWLKKGRRVKLKISAKCGSRIIDNKANRVMINLARLTKVARVAAKFL